MKINGWKDRSYFRRFVEIYQRKTTWWLVQFPELTWADGLKKMCSGVAVLSLWYDQKGKAKIAGSLSLIRSKCLATLEEGSKYLSVSHAVQNLNLTDCKFEALGTNLTYVVLLNSRRSNVSFHFGIHLEVMKWENLALSSMGFDFTAKWLQFFYPVIVTQVRWASLKWENYGVSFMWCDFIYFLCL